jgi:hypothetical protein
MPKIDRALLRCRRRTLSAASAGGAGGLSPLERAKQPRKIQPRGNKGVGDASRGAE